jgi:hypothetical protein
MDIFCKQVVLLFPHIVIEDLYRLWNQCGTCDAIITSGKRLNQICSKPCIGKQCSVHKKRCAFIITSVKKSDKICNKPCLNDGPYCSTHNRSLCTILLQHGKRKNQQCNKPCATHQKTCQAHIGLSMCQQPNCKRTTQSTICLLHQKEQEHRIQLEKPVIRIRRHGLFYVILNTLVVINPMLNVILGHLENDIIKKEYNESVEKVCLLYNLRYQPDIDTD